MIRLEKICWENHLSKRKLANESGVDACYISYAMGRGFRLYDGQLERIAAALGYDGDPHELLDEVEE